MEALLKFLFGNIYMLFIIVSILAALFRRSKAVRGSRPGRPLMPPFGEPAQGRPSAGRSAPQERPAASDSRPSRSGDTAWPVGHARPAAREGRSEQPLRLPVTADPREAAGVDLLVGADPRSASSMDASGAMAERKKQTAPQASLYAKASGPEDAALNIMSDDGAPSRSDVVRGIVWGEIMAPPRAKRPYRR